MLFEPCLRSSHCLLLSALLLLPTNFKLNPGKQSRPLFPEQYQAVSIRKVASDQNDGITILPNSQGDWDFRVVFRTIAEKSGRTILAEDVPLRTRLTAEQIKPIRKTIVNEKLSAEEAIRRIALLYDYDVSFDGKLTLLRKKFSDDNDIPDVTVEECRLSLQDLLRKVRPLLPNLPPTESQAHPLRQLVHTFLYFGFL